MKYYAILKQRGEGCDYTIRCGEKTVYLCDDKDKIQPALEEVLEYHGSDYRSDTRMGDVTILEVQEVIPYDIDAFYANQEAAVKAEREQRKKDEELAKLAELRAKYPEA